MTATIRRRIALVGALLLSAAALVAPSTSWAQQSLLDLANANSAANLLSNGGFEAPKPAYWDASGSGAMWADDVFRTPGHSLELTGSGEASWTQEEAVRNWTSRIKGNQEIVVGGWVKTDGVNTAPASDDEKFQLVFEFFDASGNDLLGEPVAIDVPQDAATSGDWVKIDNTSLGALSLPADAPSARITFRKGANAMGSAYLDDVFLYNAGDGDWPGDWFNPNVDAGDTWYYWWNNFGLGQEGWPETASFVETVTDEAAHTGTHSLKLEENVEDPSQEAVAISDRVPVTVGEPVLVSFWVKTEGVEYPDSTGTGDYNIGMTALWYSSLESGSAGYNELGGSDIRLNGEYNPEVIPLYPQQTSTDWKQYAFVVNPREGAVGIELRLRYWHKFDGTTYWDDVSITSLGGDALVGTAIEQEPEADAVPQTFKLRQNYPNPFNPSTTIDFDLPARQQVTLEVYNVIGQRVATLVSGRLLEAGTHSFMFDAADLPSGTYLYVLKTERTTEARTMVLLK